jgi:hypothetical protein
MCKTHNNGSVVYAGLFYQPLAKYNVTTDPVQNLITIDCMVRALFLEFFSILNYTRHNRNRKKSIGQHCFKLRAKKNAKRFVSNVIVICRILVILCPLREDKESDGGLLWGRWN